MQKFLFLSFLIIFSYPAKSEKLKCSYNQIMIDDNLTDNQYKNSYKDSSIHYVLNDGWLFEADIDFNQNSQITLESLYLLDDSYLTIDNLIGLGTDTIIKRILFYFITHSLENKLFKKNLDGEKKFNVEDAIDFFLSENFQYEDLKKILLSSASSNFSIKIEEEELFILAFETIKKDISKKDIIHLLSKHESSRNFPYSQNAEKYMSKKKLITFEKLLNNSLKNNKFTINQTIYDDQKLQYSTIMPSVSIEYNFSSHHPDYIESVYSDVKKIKNARLPSITFWFSKSKRADLLEYLDKSWVSWIWLSNYSKWNEDYKLAASLSIGGYCINLSLE